MSTDEMVEAIDEQRPSVESSTINQVGEISLQFDPAFPIVPLPEFSTAMTAVVATAATPAQSSTEEASTEASSTDAVALPDNIPTGILPGGRRRRNLQTETI
jgi:hypothetical protein